MSEILTHIDLAGKAKMVDISKKGSTDRMAVAKGQIMMKAETLALITNKEILKGDVFTVAHIAGVMAAKRTAEIIPLCHTIPLAVIALRFEVDNNLPGVDIIAEVKTQYQTGIEMEALTAVSVAALTIYDMVKAVDKTMRINNIRLVEKRGGKSGVLKND